MYKKIFIVLAVLAFSGCSTNVDFKIPDKEAPAEFFLGETLDNVNLRTSKILDTFWWKKYGDLLLDELVEGALKNNFDILEATSRVRQAEKELELLGIGEYLKSDLSLNSGITDQYSLNGKSDSETEASLLGGIGIMFSPDISGQVYQKKKYAVANLTAEQELLKGTVLRISSEVVQEYIKLRGYQEQLIVLDNSIKLQNNMLEIIKVKYNSGISTEFDMQRTIVAVNNLISDRPDVEDSINRSILNLANLSGKFINNYDYLYENESVPTYNGDIPKVIPVKVLSLRSDVRQSEAKLKQAIANIGIAESKYYPTFEINGKVNIGIEGISSSSIADILVSSISAVIDQTLFDGGKTSIGVDIAREEAQQSLLRYKSTMNRAVSDVESSLSALKSSYAKTLSLAKVVDASKESEKQAELLYQNGVIDLLSVLDSQRTLADTQQKYILANAAYSTEIAKLFLALGVGNNQ